MRGVSSGSETNVYEQRRVNVGDGSKADRQRVPRGLQNGRSAIGQIAPSDSF